jgi:hypothetical protein
MSPLYRLSVRVKCASQTRNNESCPVLTTHLTHRAQGWPRAGAAARRREPLHEHEQDRQAHDWTNYAVQLLIKAAENGSEASIENATRQVQRALFREGMV